VNWLEDIGIPAWAKWCRRCGNCGIGYPSITQEGRLAEGYLPGINGQGVRMDTPDLAAEAVEMAVSLYSSQHPENALAFRDYHVKRYSLAKIRRRLKRGYGASAGDIEQMIAVAAKDIGDLVKHPG
jgi:hypothetical protein